MLFLNKLIHEEKGFLSTYLLGFIIVFIMVAFFMFYLTAFSIRERANKIYYDLGVSLDYATQSASKITSTASIDPDEFINNFTDLNDSDIRDYFVYAFKEVTKSYFTGDGFISPEFIDEIELVDFYKVRPGDSIPPDPVSAKMPHFNGVVVAKQPGYVVSVNVPVYDRTIFGIHKKYSIPMRLYRVVQPLPNKKGV